jgi:signal transduction histidine kinase
MEFQADSLMSGGHSFLAGSARTIARAVARARTKTRVNTQALSNALSAAEELASHAMQLQELTAALSQAQTENQVADVVLDQGLEFLGAVSGVLARAGAGRFEMIRVCGYKAEMEERLLSSPVDRDDPMAAAVADGEPLWLTSCDEHVARFPRLYKKSGMRPPHASVAIPLHHAGVTVGALAMTFRDASAFGAVRRAFTLLLAQAAADALARARNYDAERSARHGAESLAQARADVLGIVAHDLRNPLGLIASSAEILVELDLPLAQRRKTADIMRRAVRRMNRMIGDLLDATRLQAGHLSLEVTDVDARRIVGEVEETLRAAAAEQRVALNVSAPDEDCVVLADEGRLLQVIENLVGNAIKFTNAGGRVVVAVRRRELDAVFSVTDTGPGIPPEHQRRLFDNFWQANSHDRRGLGLGLAITREIVNAHGGRLWVDSAVGVGSTFSFTVPIAADAQLPAHVVALPSLQRVATR